MITELTHEKVLEKLEKSFPGLIQNSSSPYDLLTFEIDPARAIDVIRFLKEDPELDFGYLTDLCGIHFPEKKGQELGVIYHLHSLRNNFRIRIKAFLPLENPSIKTLTVLYKGANWMERETYDFYGIIFEGHPDLRRILNVDDMTAFPMRKEFPLEDPNRRDKHDEYFGR